MKNKLYITTLLVVGIVLIVNLISQDFFLRLDFTQGKQYTMSKATKEILRNLEQPVTVKAYYSENLPPDVAKGKKEMKELLIEYSNISKGNLVYEFLDPNSDEKIERNAQQEGIQPVMINLREKDQVKQQKAYLGVVVSMGDKKETIPFIEPGGALEYTLSTAIKKVSITSKPTIGLLQGHGEPGVGEIPQVYHELSVMYRVEPLSLTDTTTIPERIETLIILNPQDSIPTNHIAQLDEFLGRGGKMMIALNRLEADLQRGFASSKNTGLETWLKGKGLIINDNAVVDARCASVQVQQQHGSIRMMSSMQFPYFPIISNFASHPASEGLTGVVMQFPSQVEFKGDSSVIFTPLAFTSEKSGTARSPIYIDIQRKWTNADFPKQNLAIAAAVEGPIGGNVSSKMVIIGNGDFVINGSDDRGQQLQPDNVNFFVNSIDWLSDDTGLIALRTKGITYRPLDQISDGTKTLLKWMNFLLPIVIILVYGIIRAQINRNKRIKRMEESYV
jgi:gliding-associated putative ABC transporter substrate-binding component GldG